MFNEVTKKRVNDGLSDLHLAAILKELMKGKNPLITSNQPLPNYSDSISNAKIDITSAGLDVLVGKQNRIDLVGIDWWIGGVHLYKIVK